MTLFRLPFPSGFQVIGLILISLAGTLPAAAQIDNLPIIPSVNVPISPQSLGELEEDEIPSREELRLLGLSEDEIDLIFENLENMEEPDPLETLTETQDALREPTPVQGDGGSGAVTTGGSEAGAELVTEDVESEEPDNELLDLPELIYGHKLLRTSLTVDRVDGDRAPSYYKIKAGDEVTITAYGTSGTDFQGIYTVSDDGYIFQKEAGRVYIRGMELGDATVLLRNRFGRFMDLRRSQFDLSITYSPSIRVNIVGEVAEPGTYKISSWNSAINALSFAAGPTDLGSVRRIEVRRDGETIKILDVYRFLMDPASQQDFFLEDNDYLVVPPYQKAVTVSGQVRRPHTYELLEAENLSKLIEFSGGLLPAAYTRNIQVQRFQGSQRIIVDVNYDSLLTWGGDFDLLDGDVVRIDTIPEIFENFVEIRGDVNFPGQYELRKGYRISDVLAKAQGNGKFDKIDEAYLIRLDEDFSSRYIPIDIAVILDNPASEDNMILEERDLIQVIGKEFSQEAYVVNIDGAVKNPGEFSYAKGMTLKDLLFYAGGPKTEAAVDRIEVSRIVDFDASAGSYVPTGKTDIQTVAIGFDLQNDRAAEEYLLQPYDEIYVHIAEGFRVQRKVQITGEVSFPGVYTISTGEESVVDLIARAGGLTNVAFQDGASMYRYNEETDNYRRLVLELEEAMDDPGSPFNHILLEGDSIYIPKMMDFVGLVGHMYNPEVDTNSMVSVPFEKGKRAGYYVKQYGGGFSDRAKKNRTLVIEPNGKVRRTKEVLWINLYPKVKTEGAQVYAVEKARPEKNYSDNEINPFDWNLFVSTMSASILSFATIYALVSRSTSN